MAVARPPGERGERAGRRRTDLDSGRRATAVGHRVARAARVAV
ncbi:hypothetical protein [Halorussus limi]|nr:hypothetical protein [Halorussus limi]